MAFYGPPILFLGQKDTQKKNQTNKQKTNKHGHNEGSKAEVEIQV